MNRVKVEILEKAWMLNTSNLEEPWFCESDEVYYGTKGQAKSWAVIDNDACTTLGGECISFLNIRVKRAKQFDKVLFRGEEINRNKIKDIIRKGEIESLDVNKMYYVQDRRNYVGNAVLWWGLNGSGYVTDLAKAHKYTYEEILKFNPRETDIIWESDHVETAIRQYVDMQGLESDYSL